MANVVLVTVRRPRTALIGALLAFLAVVGMAALSTWHGATFHDNDPVHAVSVAHAHGDDLSADPDAAIHVAAHMVGQGVDLPAAGVAALFAPAGDKLWLRGGAVLPKAPGPPSLLRPPRA
jgi:hypothetical protein